MGAKTPTLALLATLTATSVASRLLMAATPNIKAVAFLTILAGMAGGPLTGFGVGALTMVVSDLLYFGAGFWTLVNAFFMGVVGGLGGLFWFRRGLMPSRLELAVGGYLLTLTYDVATSLASPSVLYLLLYQGGSALALAAFQLIMNLFLPLGGALYPPGIAHELTTALLLSLLGPPILVRLNHIRPLGVKLYARQ